MLQSLCCVRGLCPLEAQILRRDSNAVGEYSLACGQQLYTFISAFLCLVINTFSVLLAFTPLCTVPSPTFVHWDRVAQKYRLWLLSWYSGIQALVRLPQSSNTSSGAWTRCLTWCKAIFLFTPPPGQPSRMQSLLHKLQHRGPPTSDFSLWPHFLLLLHHQPAGRGRRTSDLPYLSCPTYCLWCHPLPHQLCYGGINSADEGLGGAAGSARHCGGSAEWKRD